MSDTIPDLPVPATNVGQTMDGLLADLVRQNPNMAWVTQMLALQRQAAAQQAPVIDDSQAEIQAEMAVLQDALARAEGRVEKLTALNRRLAAELEAACERVADVAATVGACGLCWGEDPRCRSCRGHGKPGLFSPGNGRSPPFVHGAAPAMPPLRDSTEPQR